MDVWVCARMCMCICVCAHICLFCLICQARNQCLCLCLLASLCISFLLFITLITWRGEKRSHSHLHTSPLLSSSFSSFAYPLYFFHLFSALGFVYFLTSAKPPPPTPTSPPMPSYSVSLCCLFDQGAVFTMKAVSKSPNHSEAQITIHQRYN